MHFLSFRAQLAARLATLFLCLCLLAFGLAGQARIVLLFLLGLAIVWQAVSLVRFINHTNRQLTRYLTGLKFADFQQTLSIAHLGPSFQQLEKTLQQTAKRFRRVHLQKEQQASLYRALLEHVPTPLFMVHASGVVEILNHATRRTFNVAALGHTDDLSQFGPRFQRDVLQVRPGEAILSTINLDGSDEHFIVTAAELAAQGQRAKLISLQNIQSEINATELATWQNLLRMTCHEILNSMAPVSSSAQAAKTLADELVSAEREDPGSAPNAEDLRDIQRSLDTVLRRSEGLTRFVKSYRQLSRMAPPKKRKIAVAEYFGRLDALVGGELKKKGIDLDWQFRPPSLTLAADEDLLDQMLINLIRNAADALEDTETARISVVASVDTRQRTILEVRDNGEGVPEGQADNIFTPFFTTRKQGSGVGLALVRTIMWSHGGTATYHRGPNRGSIFRLTF